MTEVYCKVHLVLQKHDRSLLQSASGITKCDRLLLQSASGITKCDSYYKVRRNVCIICTQRNSKLLLLTYELDIDIVDCRQYL